MTKDELQREIVRTIEDYYIAQDDAEVHLADKLHALEDNLALGHISQEDYEEEESKLVSEQNNAQNEAQYLYSYLDGDLFYRWEEMTGEVVDISSFEGLLK